MSLYVTRLSSSAFLPYRATNGAAGYDLTSAEDKLIHKWSRALIKTDLSISFPDGFYGRIAGRSGLALKEIDVAGGVIDPDYRGNVGVILVNHSNVPFQVKQGDRIAQLILEKFAVAAVVETDELPETARSINGFGSTGHAH